MAAEDVTFIPQIVSLLLVMAVFSAILFGIFVLLRYINRQIQESRMRKKLTGLKLITAKPEEPEPAKPVE